MRFWAVASSDNFPSVTSPSFVVESPVALPAHAHTPPYAHCPHPLPPLGVDRVRAPCSRARLLAPVQHALRALLRCLCAPQAAMMETNQSGAMKTLLVVTAAFGAHNRTAPSISALFPPHAPYHFFVHN